MFFRGAGVPASATADVSKRIEMDKESINKYEIVRTILGRLNDEEVEMLGQRREVLKRVCEFEAFSSCWPNDQFKAKGLVADIRKHVQMKDSFTRMQQERDAEHKAAKLKHASDVARIQEKKLVLATIKTDLFSLCGQKNPHTRGKALEGVLNRLFKAYGILIREAFTLRTVDGKVIAEQIDGAIEYQGQVYLVEMKWWSEPLGVADVSPHLVRLFGRSDVRGMFVSASGYSDPAIEMCKGALRDKVIILCDLSEIVRILEIDGDFQNVLSAKIHAALLDKNPFQKFAG
jgi:hypothetical protein